MATQMCFQGGWTVLPFKCTEEGCGDPGTPKNGRKVGMQYSVNRKVYFDCDLGYELWGSEERMCQQNGTWTGQQPVCKVVDCGIPQKPENGRFVGNETTFQSSITYECDEGYELQGTKTRMCTSDKKWSGRDVICSGQSDCQRTNRQPSRRCAKSCNLETGCDNPADECLCDGDCGYSCVQKGLSCGNPPSVTNAKPQYQSTNFGAVVTYTCETGYTLSGASQRTCRGIGRWDSVGPKCLEMCSTPEIPFSTYIANPENYSRNYRTGETITLACKKGFKEVPGGNPIRICISGRWTQFPFKCEGTHACRRTTRPARTKCTLECSPEIGCGSDKYSCLCDGSCGYSCVEKGISCGNPPAISNGKLNFTGTSYNDTAHYTCDNGYNLNTEFAVKRCTAKKRWSGLTPRCLRDCASPAVPRNAIISNPSDSYRSGQKVTFECIQGFNPAGMATQMCFQGRWTVLPFKCTEGGCGDPGTPKNGRKVGMQYSVNRKVYFDCDLGYELWGSEERMCQPNGTWTGQQPVGKGISCGPRSYALLFHGKLNLHWNKLQPDTAHYTCDNGL
ncbi:sushi, von Willebrand factor type A, EGF and pentraxin domain-containing protein 1-like [Montipora foliosa]|uniref:sushi, von Willebrand factor type A, EGF and pentraxin domain-containing protein 1-like n=1 Tax=Montipora foliosa TaxID=591990 RepID=UPI0035F2170B